MAFTMPPARIHCLPALPFTQQAATSLLRILCLYGKGGQDWTDRMDGLCDDQMDGVGTSDTRFSDYSMPLPTFPIPSFLLSPSPRHLAHTPPQTTARLRAGFTLRTHAIPVPHTHIAYHYWRDSCRHRTRGGGNKQHHMAWFADACPVTSRF